MKSQWAVAWPTKDGETQLVSFAEREMNQADRAEAIAVSGPVSVIYYEKVDEQQSKRIFPGRGYDSYCGVGYRGGCGAVAVYNWSNGAG